MAVLDGTGRIVRKGKVFARPEHLEALAMSAGPLAVIATERGEVTAFPLGR